MLHML